MRLSLVFPGQGAQYIGMGASLFEKSAIAKKKFDLAAKILGERFLQVCFCGPDEELTRTDICQPTLFLHGCVAVEILRSKNFLSDCVLAYGLSLGELTALWAAEVFDFEAGLRIVYERGRLMKKACEETDGSMLCLIGGAIENIHDLCEKADVEIANMNCPGQVVISGATKNIQTAGKIAEKMEFKRIIKLNVAGAYHSRLMESARIGFEKFLTDVEFKSPKIQVLSNVTGKEAISPDEIKSLLAAQISSPVLFEKCCEKAKQLGVAEYYECGPGKTLSGIIKKCDKDALVKNFDKIEDF